MTQHRQQMEIEDEVAAGRLHARRVAEALAAGALTRPERLPSPATRGWTGGAMLAFLAVVLTVVGAVVVTAISAGGL